MYLPFPRVRPTVNLVICGPSRLRSFQRLLLTQPCLPALWDTRCEMWKWCMMRECPLEKVKPAASLSRSPASREGGRWEIRGRQACCADERELAGLRSPATRGDAHVGSGEPCPHRQAARGPRPGCSWFGLAPCWSLGVTMQNPCLQCCGGRNSSSPPNTKWVCTYFSSGLSQNHRMVGAGRDLCGSSSPTLLPKQGHLQQAKLGNNKLNAFYIASGYAQFHVSFPVIRIILHLEGKMGHTSSLDNSKERAQKLIFNC